MLTTIECLREILGDHPQRAWESLLESHRDELLRVAMEACGDRHHAEDALQEALIEIRRQAPHFVPRGDDQEAAARGWLRCIVRARAMNIARHERRLRAREQEAASLRVAIPTSPDERAVGAVREAMDELAEADRAAIILRHVVGMPQGGLASALGCSAGTARVRLHRALARLRKRLRGRIPREAFPALLPVPGEDRLRLPSQPDRIGTMSFGSHLAFAVCAAAVAIGVGLTAIHVAASTYGASVRQSSPKISQGSPSGLDASLEPVAVAQGVRLYPVFDLVGMIRDDEPFDPAMLEYWRERYGQDAPMPNTYGYPGSRPPGSRDICSIIEILISEVIPRSLVDEGDIKIEELSGNVLIEGRPDLQPAIEALLRSLRESSLSPQDFLRSRG